MSLNIDDQTNLLSDDVLHCEECDGTLCYDDYLGFYQCTDCKKTYFGDIKY